MILSITAIGTFIVSLIMMGWTVTRDKKSDNQDITSRLDIVEKKVLLLEKSTDILDKEHGEMRTALKELESNIGAININIGRILVLLEK